MGLRAPQLEWVQLHGAISWDVVAVTVNRDMKGTLQNMPESLLGDILWGKPTALLSAVRQLKEPTWP